MECLFIINEYALIDCIDLCMIDDLLGVIAALTHSLQ